MAKVDERINSSSREVINKRIAFLSIDVTPYNVIKSFSQKHVTFTWCGG